MGDAARAATTHQLGRYRSEADMRSCLASTGWALFDPNSDIDRTEIPQCISLLPYLDVLSFEWARQRDSEHFRSIPRAADLTITRTRLVAGWVQMRGPYARSIPLRQIGAAGDNAKTGSNSRCHPGFVGTSFRKPITHTELDHRVTKALRQHGP